MMSTAYIREDEKRQLPALRAVRAVRDSPRQIRNLCTTLCTDSVLLVNRKVRNLNFGGVRATNYGDRRSQSDISSPNTTDLTSIKDIQEISKIAKDTIISRCKRTT
jgi:hypothetical protein